MGIVVQIILGVKVSPQWFAANQNNLPSTIYYYPSLGVIGLEIGGGKIGELRDSSISFDEINDVRRNLLEILGSVDNPISLYFPNDDDDNFIQPVEKSVCR